MHSTCRVATFAPSLKAIYAAVTEIEEELCFCREIGPLEWLIVDPLERSNSSSLLEIRGLARSSASQYTPHVPHNHHCCDQLGEG